MRTVCSKECDELSQVLGIESGHKARSFQAASDQPAHARAHTPTSRRFAMGYPSVSLDCAASPADGICTTRYLLLGLFPFGEMPQNEQINRFWVGRKLTTMPI